MAGLDLWFRDDVRRILAGVFESMRSTTAAMIGDTENVHIVVAYRNGFEAALRAVAASFGVPDVSQPARAALEPGQVDAVRYQVIEGGQR